MAYLTKSDFKAGRKCPTSRSRYIGEAIRYAASETFAFNFANGDDLADLVQGSLGLIQHIVDPFGFGIGTEEFAF